MKLSKDVEQKIGELQKIEQSLQSFSTQKQQFQIQLSEVNSALEEIDKSDTTYKVVGNIMVLRKKDELKKELSQKKEMVELRVKTVEKQEAKIKEKATELQQQVMKEMEKSEDKK